MDTGEGIPQRLLKTAQNSDLPFAALPAIAEIRKRLRELEAIAIANARARGATWSEIAAALGVTRQALQQRLKRDAGGPPEMDQDGHP